MRIILIGILFSSTQLMHAQDRFHLALAGGLNFAELEGKHIMDYFGLNAGLVGTADLSEHWQFSLELLYSENGEYILPYFYPEVDYGKVSLKHVEVPVHFDLLIGILERERYKDLELQFGMAYAQIMDHKAETILGREVTNEFIYTRRHNLLLQLGSTYHLSEKWGVNFRASLPLQPGLEWTLTSRLLWKFS